MKIIFYVMVFLCCVACNSVQSYDIKGNLPGARDGAVVKLMNIETYPAVLLDSSIVQGEHFRLKGNAPISQVQYCQLLIDLTPEETDSRKKDLRCYRFFMDNADFTFSCIADSLPGFYYEPVNKNHHVTMTGGKDQELHNRYQQSVQQLNKQKEYLRNRYLEVYHIPAISGEFHTQEGMEIVREQKRVQDQICREMLKFIQQNPASPVAVFLASDYLQCRRAELTVEEIDALADCLDKSLETSGLFLKYRKQLEQTRCVAKGSPYHNIELLDLKGRKVNLSAYVKPGVYNMLEFWASWCGPCRGEIPHLRHLYECGGKEHFNMISISIDENKEAWKKAVREERMEWTQLCDIKGGWEGNVGKYYEVRGVPYCLILDPDGKIVCGGVRGAALDFAVSELLGDKISIR